MKLSQLKEEIRQVIRERGVGTIQKEYQKTVEEIAKALEFYKKNKLTDKKDAFVKVLKQLGEKKKALQHELDMKVQSMYKDAEYQGESVTEEENPGLWANIRAKKARGEKSSPKNSQAYKDAVKAGEEINKNESVNELKTLSNGNFKIKKQYNTFADYEKHAKIGDTILKYNKKSSMKDMINNTELNQNAKKYLNKVHSIGTDGVNVTIFGKQTPASIHPSDKKELAVVVLENTLNEAFTKGKTYGGTKCEGGCFIGKQGLMKIIKISKELPNNTFIFRQDNFSGLQPHFIKNGVIAIAKTINPSYDLERNKVRNLNIGKDVILSIQLFD
jgi:hypothetical protein